ncbi:plasmid replication initiator TrfA [Azohydromonas australica]|uniref:plasmid replication initiator TrfA n=1 Tax=Azohydromonas australica TaxID=364039 RepID=UPI001B7FECDD|nr:plasmid replication initiator TrfA [Azohydromonas australica]
MKKKIDLLDLPPDELKSAKPATPAVARLTERLQRVRSKSRAATLAAVPEPDSSESKQLPLWPERVRGLPNALARSALFCAGTHKIPRENLKQKEIYSIKGITIHYTGEELRNDDDEDVFLQVTHLARLQPLGERVEFSAHSMLKALRWDTGSAGYKRLRTVLTRLQATAVMVSAEGMERGYSGSLLRSFAWDKTRWSVEMDPKIIRLFGTTQYTRVEWEQRMRLAPLAKKLHAYYVTHRDPYPLRVETIRDLCGSRIRELSQFRPTLRLALKRLVEVGFLISWTLDKVTDQVSVVRAPQNSLPLLSDEPVAA